MNKSDQLIVALDTDRGVEALKILNQLSGLVRFFKVGSQLFTEFGPEIVKIILRLQGQVFLDLKFHDIPRTVAGAVMSASKLGVSMMTVHASAGKDALVAAVENKGQSQLFVVTVLTSIGDDPNDYSNSSLGLLGMRSQDKVFQFATLALKAGADGIVCSNRELLFLAEYPEFSQLKKLVPGIRFSDSSPDDQRRTGTAEEAVLAGANYVVAGRIVTEAQDLVVAVNRVLAEIKTAQAKKGY